MKYKFYYLLFVGFLLTSCNNSNQVNSQTKTEEKVATDQKANELELFWDNFQTAVSKQDVQFLLELSDDTMIDETSYSNEFFEAWEEQIAASSSSQIKKVDDYYEMVLNKKLDSGFEIGLSIEIEKQDGELKIVGIQELS